MMLQEIAPHIYDNSYSFDPPCAEDFAVIWRDGCVMLSQQQEQIALPHVGDFAPMQWQFLFRIDGVGYYLNLHEQPLLPEFSWVSQREVADRSPQETAFAVCAAGSLARWYAGTRFCSACAAPMEHSTKERAMVCPACGRTVYPTISPAVIVGVTDGEKMLLTRYAGRAFRRYALVAGFAEIGEPIEDTVRREVLEETGLQVKDLRFYRSQPWGFTDTLLLGFFCRVDGAQPIRLQEDELSEATWFFREELSYDHTHTSLTGEMIEFFRTKGPDAIWNDKDVG